MATGCWRRCSSRARARASPSWSAPASSAASRTAPPTSPRPSRLRASSTRPSSSPIRPASRRSRSASSGTSARPTRCASGCRPRSRSSTVRASRRCASSSASCSTGTAPPACTSTSSSPIPAGSSAPGSCATSTPLMLSESRLRAPRRGPTTPVNQPARSAGRRTREERDPVALVKPPLASVEPGRPITAQGWNSIVDALGALYDAVLAIGSGSVTVSAQSDGHPVPGAQVVAEPVEGSGQPVDGLPLFGTRDSYLVTGVSDGAWRLFVSAPGFVSQTIEVTVPSAAPVTVNLVLAGKVVPDLFDQPLQGALAALSAAGVDVDVIVDALGQEISRTQVPADAQNSPVLVQYPGAGS